MDCPSCGHQNREGARFCARCAAPLQGPVACPSCGAQSAPGASFCDSCGQPLAAVPAERDPRSYVPEHLAEKVRVSGSALAGERKQVTVLFADVMNSMDLAEESDAEEWRRIMDRFFAILCEGVQCFEGTVDKFTGDGVIALFGAPIAHEDHGARACHAALGLSETIGRFSAELRRERGLNFLVRLGPNSGEVVVGGIGQDLAMEYTAVDHTVGLAQRMEALAEPGKVEDRPPSSHDRATRQESHDEARELALTFAEHDAAAHHFKSALQWLEVLEQIDGVLPAGYVQKRADWQARARGSATSRAFKEYER